MNIKKYIIIVILIFIAIALAIERYYRYHNQYIDLKCISYLETDRLNLLNPETINKYKDYSMLCGLAEYELNNSKLITKPSELESIRLFNLAYNINPEQSYPLIRSLSLVLNSIEKEWNIKKRNLWLNYADKLADRIINIDSNNMIPYICKAYIQLQRNNYDKAKNILLCCEDKRFKDELPKEYESRLSVFPKNSNYPILIYNDIINENKTIVFYIYQVTETLLEKKIEFKQHELLDLIETVNKLANKSKLARDVLWGLVIQKNIIDYLKDNFNLRNSDIKRVENQERKINSMIAYVNFLNSRLKELEKRQEHLYIKKSILNTFIDDILDKGEIEVLPNLYNYLENR